LRTDPEKIRTPDRRMVQIYRSSAGQSSFTEVLYAIYRDRFVLRVSYPEALLREGSLFLFLTHTGKTYGNSAPGTCAVPCRYAFIILGLYPTGVYLGGQGGAKIDENIRKV
jgi:hypothetical protein